MISFVAMSLAGGGLVETAGTVDLGRGAIAGAFFVAAAFLAGYAVIRRSGLAIGALLLVIAAGAMQLSWLGLFTTASPEVGMLLQGLFAAAVIVFLSASIRAARFNAILGGLMFTAALVLAGLGIINFFDRVDVTPLMRWGVMGVGGFAILLAASQALRGDSGAQIILPGALLAALAPFVGTLGASDTAAFAVLPHGLFTLGILAASLVALTEGGHPRASVLPQVQHGEPAPVFSAGNDHHHSRFDRRNAERDEIVIDSQIARVLDYTGLATWDWSEDSVEQTPALPAILGADSSAPFTPSAMLEFIHADDKARFKRELMLPRDGKFDVSLKLFDGRVARFRGARAGDTDGGALERIVAFIEEASGVAKNPAAPLDDAENGVTETTVRKATEAAIVPAAASLAAGATFSKAIDNGDIVAAFQPIVSLSDEKIAGYEALARWRDQEDGADEGPESFVKTAEAVGKGGALADIMLDAAGAFLADKIKREKRNDLFVTLNVSFGQMRGEGFVAAVANIIEKHKLPENALVLELTEADAVSDRTTAGSLFRRLKNAGAALAFDDFGAGFSSLTNLHKFDFDYIKIDKSFVSGLEKDSDGAKIVSSLANLGKDLGMKVIAEGVETKETGAALKKIGCAFAQGFAFGKAVELSDERTRPAKAKKSGKERDTADLTDEDDEEAKSGRWRIWRTDLR